MGRDDWKTRKKDKREKRFVMQKEKGVKRRGRKRGKGAGRSEHDERVTGCRRTNKRRREKHVTERKGAKEAENRGRICERRR